MAGIQRYFLDCPGVIGNVRTNDELMDELHRVYLRASSRESKANALTALLSASEPFLVRVVRSLSRSGPIKNLDEEDRMQTARIGFLEAVKRQDPELGPLRPYAMRRIQHELQSLAEISFSIKVPRRSGLPAPVLQKIAMIWSKEGREPTREELNGHFEDYQDVLSRPRVVTSLDAPASGSQDRTVAEVVGSSTPDALEQLIAEEARVIPTRIQEAIDSALCRSATQKTLPKRKEKPVMAEKTLNPLEALDAAVEGVKTYIASLDEQEAEIHRRREEAKAKLAKVMPSAPVRAGQPGPMLTLNQNKLHHKVIAFLKDHPESRLAAIATGTGASREEVSKTLIKLAEHEQISKSGKARATSYSVAKKKAKLIQFTEPVRKLEVVKAVLNGEVHAAEG